MVVRLNTQHVGGPVDRRFPQLLRWVLSAVSAAKLVQLQLALQLQEGFQAVHPSGFAAEYDLN